MEVTSRPVGLYLNEISGLFLNTGEVLFVGEAGHQAAQHAGHLAPVPRVRSHVRLEAALR